jgi:6-phosphogluconolactonase
MMSERRFLVGTYTLQRASRGLYLCSMQASGRIEVHDACAMPDPSFVIVHPALPIAYTVNETPNGHGGVSAVAIEDDRLEELQRIDSGGDLPCHLALLDDARALTVAHYGCGTVGVFELDERGALTGARRTWRHTGRSVNARRQDSAHPHYVLVGATGVYVTDLGQDCIVHYAGSTGATLSETSRCAIHAGAGPRHLDLDEANGVGWLSNELDNTVSRLAIDADGALREVDWVGTLPPDFAGRSAVSEISRHPSGRWLYVGNRGHDSLAWYDIGPEGRLVFNGTLPAQGRHPRHFAVTRDGAAMLVANRDSDNLVAFGITSSGRPEPLGKPFAGVPAPVCVHWL